MGWMQVGVIAEGEKVIDLVWGDAPADAMDVAIQEIVEAYEKEWDRKPYVAELRHLLSFCVLPEQVEDKEHLTELE